jgi:bifunctional non-homologous end joining protein LigD
MLSMLHAFSLPTKSDKVPTGSDWIHEIKYDGYRMMVVREQDRVRLISRGGYDWTERFPLVVSAALKLPLERFVLDGEVVVLDKDGVSDFDALASRKHDKRAMLYAFDLLAGEGEDLRSLPLGIRKVGLAQLLSDPVDGVFIAEYERGDIGDVLFRVACNMSFCNGPVCVNPSLRLRSTLRRGRASVRGRRAGRALMGFKRIGRPILG